jgi:polysaccharide export outer membrane protein
MLQKFVGMKCEFERKPEGYSGMSERVTGIWIWRVVQATLVGACLWTVACAGHRANQPQDDRLSTDLPQAGQPSVTAGAAEYRISPADVLLISVFNEPDLSLKVTVSPDGTINYPLLQSVQLAGLSILEAQEKLAGLLGKDYLVTPSVTIAVDQGRRHHVYLLGQVKTPGSLDIAATESLTLLQAISRAGGFTEFAARDRVMIIRSRNGRKETMVVNVAAIIGRGDLSRDVVLQAEDVVSVPQTYF